MSFNNQIDFFIKFMNANNINTTVITDNKIPDNIDLGIRQEIGLTNDYKKLFNIQNFSSDTITKTIDIFLSTYFFIPVNKDNINKFLVVGPYITKKISNEDIDAGCATLSLLPNTTKNIQNYFNTVAYISDENFINTATSCLNKCLFGESTDYTVKNFHSGEITDAAFHIRKKAADESESPLASIQAIERAYEMENKLLNAISQGLVHKAEEVFGTIKPSSILENRFSDKLRNAKNFMLVLNTLARKAVEQGGVHPIYIDGISSDFSLKIENAPTVDECDKLFLQMIRKYSLLVQQHNQKGYSALVSRVITSVDTDITADLSLKNMAKLLNVNPSYLSTHFKKETGKTLTDYVNNRRIERAKQLLKSQNLQIQTVAQSCGIFDVNYFTKLFKKYTGVTPKEYKAL